METTEHQDITYQQSTHDVEVSVVPTFAEAHSNPEQGVYVWAYQVEIANRGNSTLRLTTRHWQITNAFGQRIEVHGEGVVGNQPVLRPGETFTYMSYANLSTPSGFMVGSYDFTCEDGSLLKVPVPSFFLNGPTEYMIPN